MNDQFGRRPSILIADVLSFCGAIIMALAPMPGIIILGRIFVGFGVGMASMTSSLYISEASPAKIRGSLVSTNGLLITGGQFLSYLVNLTFTKTHGTWRWMLGVGGVTAFVQFVLMLMLPESTRWLYRKGRVDEATVILKKIYPAHQVEKEIEMNRVSVEDEIVAEGGLGEASTFSKTGTAWSRRAVRRGLIVGIICQVAQQFVGIKKLCITAPQLSSWLVLLQIELHWRSLSLLPISMQLALLLVSYLSTEWEGEGCCFSVYSV